MKDYGLVSVITASYNCAEFIAATIESVQAQTYTNWELLITDDFSDDSSREVVERYAAADTRIRLFPLRINGGAGDARNNSIREAKGRFIAFCDSDDRWYPRKLERQLEFMVNGGHALTYTSYDTCDETGHLNGVVNCLPRLNRAAILRDNGIGCLSAIYDTAKIGKHYMPSIRKRQDWCLWIDIISTYGPAYGLQERLALYRVRNGSISSGKLKLIKYNYAVYHEVLGYNALTSAVLLGGYFLPYYFYKKFRQRLDFKKNHDL